MVSIVPPHPITQLLDHPHRPVSAQPLTSLISCSRPTEGRLLVYSDKCFFQDGTWHRRVGAGDRRGTEGLVILALWECGTEGGQGPGLGYKGSVNVEPE